MTAETSGDGVEILHRGEARRWLAAVALSPIVWGGLLTVGFYAAIPHLPLQREMAERYFCSHPLEYATAALFFVGMATLALKALRLWTERRALSADILDGPEPESSGGPLRRAEQIEARLRALPRRLRRTHLAERIGDVCIHIRGRLSTKGLEEHLKYLAELASQRLHESYALVRTITWAVPILGFLGTVIGITIAIANVTPEQLDSSLGEVTGGLAVAFDTTALALALSIVLVFFSFVVERAEQQILGEVEDFGIKRITSLFPPEAGPKPPLLEAESQAARHLLEKTESLISWQTDLWRDSLESLRTRWTDSLETQKHDFDAALQQGMRSTLADHEAQLTEARGELVDAFRGASRDLQEGIAESRDAQRAMQDAFTGRMDELWQCVQADIAALRDDQQVRIEQLTRTVAERVAAWQTQLEQATEAGTEQLGEIRRQREVLLQVASQEEQLVRLQDRLAENLEAVRATETFEETLHSLSAAVHLLTARTRPKAA